MTVTATAEDTRPTLEHLDPRTLHIADNVRLDPRLHDDFIESIRERGVLTPIVGYRDGDAVHVLMGQRRTLAAIETGHTNVPVYVAQSRDTADRIIDQLHENDKRTGFTDAERVGAYEQLAAFGLTADDIANKAKRPKSEVQAALATSRSKLARAGLERWDFLTLEQSAVLAEFDDDKDALTTLVQAAKNGGFAHTAQRLRDRRAEQAELAATKAAAEQELAAAGVRVIEEPDEDVETNATELEQLTHDGADLDETNHAECPGHGAYLVQAWVYPDPDDESGHRSPYLGWSPLYVCTDPAAHGHAMRPVDAKQASTDPAAKSEEQREADKAKRRDVIQSNQDWRSAETVRCEWLTTFLTRQKPPKGAASFIAGSLARADHEITQAQTSGNKLATELFGLDDTGKTGYGRTANSAALLKHLATASEARATVVTLGLVLAAYEERTGVHSWRANDQATTRYLRFLETNGYELAPVERRACGEEISPDTGEPAALDEQELQ